MADPPLSAGIQARYDQANAGLAGLPDIYNPQRKSLAYDTAASLNDQGYFSGAAPTETNTAGDITYKLARGPDGRLYAQAYRSIANAQNAHGTYFSSFNERAQTDQRRTLNAAREAIMRQYGSQSDTLNAGELAGAKQYTNDKATALGDQKDYGAQWIADHPVTPPAPADPAASAPAAPVPTPVTAATAPKRAMGYADFLKGRASTSALAHQWDQKFNYGRRFG